MNESDRRQQASQFHTKGRQVYNIGQFHEAIKLYDQALRLDPNNPRIWYDKANVFRNWHRQLPGPANIRQEEAISCYRRAISLDPDYADAWGNMGVSFGALGDHKQALICFETALRLEPSDENWIRMREVARQKIGNK